MKGSFEQRVAVVTGGSSGIGLEAVRLLLRNGARVALCGRDEARLARAVESLQGLGDESAVLAQPCDVLDKASVQAFAHAVEARFGRVDFLIANAGQGRVASLEETQDEDWVSETRLKLMGLLHPLKAFQPMLERSDCASVTCVNSLLSLQPEPHMIATSAARAALLNLTHSLAQELVRKRIRVNSILLGMVESGQWRRRFELRSDTQLDWTDWTARIAAQRGIPMGRMGRPEEAAQALLFLASPLASYTTGSCIDVSGGFSRQL
ncbi:SDR family oxidoreductase [Dyella sp. ASV21]|jgi:NAD(P)-dependent dehydrogenase (short-subunit alcohol dehydrogenase family)|uniref:SDR family oxidoreductase n=1 Tax=Dyella sp. ASV21 TaxID=2795114 RepID=UPI0018EB4F1D|nr:SDR family oxidoreductase [Dyella sp. ASV21]